MTRKVYLIMGLILIACAIVVIYWQTQQPDAGKTPDLKSVGKMDCATAQFPFACYLDKAMAAKDPGLCMAAGRGKRSNCLQSYAEIMNAEIDCGQISDPEFSAECSMAFSNYQADSSVNSSEPGTMGDEAVSSSFIGEGLNIDRP